MRLLLKFSAYLFAYEKLQQYLVLVPVSFFCPPARNIFFSSAKVSKAVRVPTVPFCLHSYSFYLSRRQESVDLLLGLNRPVVDQAGNILDEFIQEPLDLDLWATRLSQPQHPPTRQQHKEEGERSSAAATATGKRGGGGGTAGRFPHPAASPYLAAPSSEEGACVAPEEAAREGARAAGAEGGAGVAAIAPTTAGGRRKSEELSGAREKARGRKAGASTAEQPLLPATGSRDEARHELERKTQQRSGHAPPSDRRRRARPEGPG